MYILSMVFLQFSIINSFAVNEHQQLSFIFIPHTLFRLDPVFSFHILNILLRHSIPYPSVLFDQGNYTELLFSSCKWNRIFTIICYKFKKCIARPIYSIHLHIHYLTFSISLQYLLLSTHKFYAFFLYTYTRSRSIMTTQETSEKLLRRGMR